MKAICAICGAVAEVANPLGGKFTCAACGRVSPIISKTPAALTCETCGVKWKAVPGMQGQISPCPSCGADCRVPYEVQCVQEGGTGRKMIRAQGKAFLRIDSQAITVALEKPTRPFSYWWAIPLTIMSGVVALAINYEGFVAPGLLGWILILWLVNRSSGYTVLTATPGTNAAICRADKKIVRLELTTGSRQSTDAQTGKRCLAVRPLTGRWVSLRPPLEVWTRVCEDLRKVYGERLQAVAEDAANLEIPASAPERRQEG